LACKTRSFSKRAIFLFEFRYLLTSALAYNKAMITKELLQRSQDSRPRYSIVALGWISLLIVLITAGLQGFLVLPDSALFEEWSIHGSFIPDMNLATFMVYIGGPIIAFLFGIVPFVLINRMAKFRHPYLWLSIPVWIVFVLYIIAMIAIYVVMFVPGVGDLLFKYVPIDYYYLALNIFIYLPLGYDALLLIGAIFGIFYNVNYPAKYEEIYARRKARLKAYPNYKDKDAYRARFYENYRDGNWEQMMLDLFYVDLLDKDAPISEETMLFMAEYGGYSESKIKRAAFNAYCKKGQFREAREDFMRTLKAKEAVEGGAKIVFPDEITPLPEPVKPVRTYPAPYVPPLRPADERRPKDPTSTKWRPEDI